ncbi:MAG: hypothetical protein ACKO5K_15635 [Armatimonadota bacterium]
MSARTFARPFAALAALAGFAALGAPAHAQFLIDDPFDMLSSTWTVQRGTASIADGWVRLQGSYGIGRDAFIVAGEGAPWTDYRLVTRFHSDGGGNNWFNALINFRVQSFFGWSDGNWYGFYLYPPNSAIPPSGGFFLVKKTIAGGYQALQPTYYDSSPFLIGDNLVDIEVQGGDVQLRLNGTLAATYSDPDPIPNGGVALGSIWESITRYDFAKVIEPYTLVPTAQTLQPRRTGAAFPIRFRIEDLSGANPSSANTPVTVLRVRNATTGEPFPARAPGIGNPPTCVFVDGAYVCVLSTTGLAPGDWLLEVNVNGDPRTRSVPFGIR